MLSEFFLKIPYLLFFIPLITSIVIYYIEDQKFTVNVIYTMLTAMIFLTFNILFKVEDVATYIFVNTSGKFNILGGEFKISVPSIFFLLLVLICNFIGFINYINNILTNNTINRRCLKYFFVVYVTYIFSTVGIMLTYNIFNLFIFLEVYSFCMYIMVSIYRNKNLNIVSYKYFSNNIFGSILSMLSLFYMSVYFNTSNMLNIKQQLLTINLKDNVGIFLIFILFVFSLIIKFFTMSTSRYYNTDFSGISFLSISNIFVNVLIGIYLMLEIVFFIFDSRALLDIPLLRVMVFITFGLIIIYNSVRCLTVKDKSLYNIFVRFNLVSLGYIMLATFLYDNGLKSSWALLFSHSFEFVSVNLTVYIFLTIISTIYNHNDVSLINDNKFFKFFLMFVILYKIFLPIGTSLYTNTYFVTYVIKNRNFLYLLPFLINKISYAFLFLDIYENNRIADVSRDRIVSTKHLYKLYFSIFLLLVITIVFEVFFQKYNF
ncbi:MAG: hypothetical protein LBS34_01705 [Rickettsiales bacterium]|nr:hypothetical protein [Rickettsiales bacterium]